ncbi:2-(5''-triphosphoribosyl)-3'-dephosphocoenzyme-A synthase [Agrilactobacillus composti DSM 18527 = JCM 14202]|nr:2-(5''-triphosphoribosyl)-3'-dephosphocoenzyme-A synthase [Agrilactobacillus composti DSM 18527 = JCM 14202]
MGHVLATSQIELADWTKANTDAVFTTIAQMTQALDHDFDNLASKDKLSYGEKLYLDYGIKGVRGEAAAGYPALRDYGLPFLRRTQNTPRHVRLLDLFLELLANTTDSNVIHRSDMATLRRIQHQVQALLAQGGIAKLGVEPMVQLNKEFIALNISPGGTADLLAASVFLGFLEKLF